MVDGAKRAAGSLGARSGMEEARGIGLQGCTGAQAQDQGPIGEPQGYVTLQLAEASSTLRSIAGDLSESPSTTTETQAKQLRQEGLVRLLARPRLQACCSETVKGRASMLGAS